MNRAGDLSCDDASGASRCVGRRLVILILLAMLTMSIGPLGCASKSPSVVHRVEAGENLYRIGLRYGVDAKRIARANGIHDERSLRIGQRLLIPSSGRRGASRASASRTQSASVAKARERARATARQQGSLKFAWPVKGRLSSTFGRRRGKPHDGIDIAARKGTPIFASESGRVIHSGRMGGYGKVVIVKHAGAYRSVYAHASVLLVRKGEFVERGQKIAEVGSTGRSTGPHVHFEIRQKERPQNPLALLP